MHFINPLYWRKKMEWKLAFSLLNKTILFPLRQPYRKCLFIVYDNCISTAQLFLPIPESKLFKIDDDCFMEFKSLLGWNKLLCSFFLHKNSRLSLIIMSAIDLNKLKSSFLYAMNCNTLNLFFCCALYYAAQCQWRLNGEVGTIKSRLMIKNARNDFGSIYPRQLIIIFPKFINSQSIWFISYVSSIQREGFLINICTFCLIFVHGLNCYFIGSFIISSEQSPYHTQTHTLLLFYSGE